jgi:hypothetical protein
MPALRRWHGRLHVPCGEMSSLATPVTADHKPTVCLGCAVKAACENAENSLGYTRYPMSPWSEAVQTTLHGEQHAPERRGAEEASLQEAVLG